MVCSCGKRGTAGKERRGRGCSPPLCLLGVCRGQVFGIPSELLGVPRGGEVLGFALPRPCFLLPPPQGVELPGVATALLAPASLCLDPLPALGEASHYAENAPASGSTKPHASPLPQQRHSRLEEYLPAPWFSLLVLGWQPLLSHPGPWRALTLLALCLACWELLRPASSVWPPPTPWVKMWRLSEGCHHIESALEAGEGDWLLRSYPGLQIFPGRGAGSLLPAAGSVPGQGVLEAPAAATFPARWS